MSIPESNETTAVSPRKLKCYLMDLEQSMIKMMRPAPGVINFFEVIDDFPESWLYSRACEIYRLNPWLGGRLKQTDKGIALVFKSDEQFPGFNVVYNSGISVKLSYDELYAHPSMLEMAAPKGGDAMKNDLPLFKVTIFKQETKEVVIGISISHTVGDARTLFQIMSMFDKDTTPFVLLPKRVKDFSAKLGDILTTEFPWHDSKTSIAGVVGNLLFRPMEIDHKMMYYEFENSEVDTVKSRYKTDTSFVSTNDIITSWLAKEVDTDFVLMMVDFRNRVEGVTLQHSGNYSHDVILDRKQFDTPTAVRKVVNDINLHNTKEPYIPSAMETLNFNSMMLTSWVAFYHDFNVEGCVNLMQIPYWSKEDIRRIPWRHCGCIFSPRKGQIALNWASKSHASPNIQRMMRSSPIIRTRKDAIPGEHIHFRVPTGTLRSLLMIKGDRWLTSEDEKLQKFLEERSHMIDNSCSTSKSSLTTADSQKISVSEEPRISNDVDAIADISFISGKHPILHDRKNSKSPKASQQSRRSKAIIVSDDSNCEVRVVSAIDVLAVN